MHTTLLTALALALALPPVAAQEAGTTQTPPRFQPPVARPPAEPLDKDGKPLVPGVLPADTSEAARVDWERVCAATRVAPADDAPVAAIQGFDLAFDVRARSGTAGQNEARVRFRFLSDPGYLRYTLESGREHLRGPDGDWLVTGERVEPLTSERFAAEDKQQIEQGVAIARNFVALTDPSKLRIASLALVSEPPIGLPEPLRQRARELEWLDVESPDFQLIAHRDAPSARDASAVFRVLLGHDGKGRVALAIVQRDAGAPGRLDPGALLVELRSYEPLDGFMVPRQLVVHEVDETARPPAFRARDSMDLYRVIGEGGLRAALGPDDFRPGKPTTR